jgi:hypothetical protein
VSDPWADVTGHRQRRRTCLTRLTTEALLAHACTHDDTTTIRALTMNWSFPFYIPPEGTDATILATTRIYLAGRPPRTSDLRKDDM